jgi:hypothetical protein
MSTYVNRSIDTGARVDNTGTAPVSPLVQTAYGIANLPLLELEGPLYIEMQAGYLLRQVQEQLVPGTAAPRAPSPSIRDDIWTAGNAPQYAVQQR